MNWVAVRNLLASLQVPDHAPCPGPLAMVELVPLYGCWHAGESLDIAFMSRDL